MLSKTNSVVSFCIFLISTLCCSCNQTESEHNVIKEPTETSFADSVRQGTSRDSLEDLADKMRDESSELRELSVSVSIAEWWSADKNLNTVRQVTLRNTSDKKVVGVKLVYALPVGKSVENRDMGKFKVSLKPLGTVTLKVPARRFGVSDNIIERDIILSSAFPDKVIVSVVYFENGSIESLNVPIGFQNKD